MHVPGNEKGHAGPSVCEMQFPPHAEFFSQSAEDRCNLLPTQIESFQFPLDPHKKNLLGHRGMLIRVNDVSIVLEDEIRYRGDDPSLVGAG